ncbi:hypothetical protein A7A76_21805 [Lysobacter enzymogenes]|uniref:hypothetical protein n=1 Tax=Lysobacter enzymogenes TaxID=69 RepID=UPI0019D19DF9|nr:hypothetical protein [Lysobacter enzymogenes]MBN7137356.1 hypothetical protein [Lysobacter enzymogenes]
MYATTALATRFRPIWLYVLLAPACAGPTLTHKPAKEIAAMPHPLADASAPLESRQLIARVLRLIDSIHGIADLAPDNVEQQTGLSVRIHSTDRTEYAASGRIDSDWAYSLASVSYRQGQAPSRLDFDFIDTRADRSGPANPTAICTLDLDGYRRALSAQDFKQTQLAGHAPDPGFGFRGVELLTFARGKVEVSLRTYGDRAPDDGRACICGLRISVQP